ncbi:MAG: FAD:protein FMN transferase [Desulfobacteraceae bacterium]|nr:MAG: FAD:protein FMN transferase [Desulfobacteraceae bacterium]
MEKRLDQYQLNRRSFLKMSGLLGLGVASAGIIPVTAETVKFDQSMYKVSKTKLGIGTFVAITLLHSSKDQAEQALGLAFTEVSRLENVLNRFDQRTGLSYLNQKGNLKSLPPDLETVIAASLYYHRLTNGAFDITVQPIVDYYKEKFQNKGNVNPSDQEIHNLLGLVDSRNILLNNRSVSFAKTGMGITLDGIAKGYIVDRVAEVLAKQKIEHFLINAGGEIRTMGKADKSKPWRIAIQDPFKKKNYPDQIELNNGALATSGSYEVYFDQEKMFHHIVNPRTGLSPHQSISVSVVAETTMQADALSTGVFVMEPGPGIAFIDTLPQCAALVMTPQGRILKSKTWKSATV